MDAFSPALLLVASGNGMDPSPSPAPPSPETFLLGSASPSTTFGDIFPNGGELNHQQLPEAVPLHAVSAAVGAPFNAYKNCIEMNRALARIKGDLTTELFPWVAVFALLYAVVIALGLAGNVLVVTAISRTRSLRSNPANVFILALSFSDMLVVACSGTITPITAFSKQWLFGRLLCSTAPFIAGVSLCFSTFTLTVISLNRFVLVRFPTKFQLSHRKALSAVLISLALSASLSAPIVPAQTLAEMPPFCGHFCYEDWDNPGLRRLYGSALLVAQFIVPLVIITFCYTTISVRLNKRAAFRAMSGSGGGAQYYYQFKHTHNHNYNNHQHYHNHHHCNNNNNNNYHINQNGCCPANTLQHCQQQQQLPTGNNNINEIIRISPPPAPPPSALPPPLSSALGWRPTPTPGTGGAVGRGGCCPSVSPCHVGSSGSTDSAASGGTLAPQFAAAAARMRAIAERKQRNNNIMFVAMVVAFVMSWIWNIVFNLLRDFQVMPDWMRDQEFLYGVSTHLLAMTSTIWNPILYALLNSQFRTAFLRYSGFKRVLQAWNYSSAMFGDVITAGPTRALRAAVASAAAVTSRSAPELMLGGGVEELESIILAEVLPDRRTSEDDSEERRGPSTALGDRAPSGQPGNKNKLSVQWRHLQHQRSHYRPKRSSKKKYPPPGQHAPLRRSSSLDSGQASASVSEGSGDSIGGLVMLKGTGGGSRKEQESSFVVAEESEEEESRNNFHGEGKNVETCCVCCHHQHCHGCCCCCTAEAAEAETQFFIGQEQHSDRLTLWGSWSSSIWSNSHHQGVGGPGSSGLFSRQNSNGSRRSRHSGYPGGSNNGSGYFQHSPGDAGTPPQQPPSMAQRLLRRLAPSAVVRVNSAPLSTAENGVSSGGGGGGGRGHRRHLHPRDHYLNAQQQQQQSQQQRFRSRPGLLQQQHQRRHQLNLNNQQWWSGDAGGVEEDDYGSGNSFCSYGAVL